MEYIVLGAFCATLLVCIILNVNLIFSLLIGLLIFICYAFKCGYSAKDIFKMSLSGVKTVKNILFTFILIGIITALWRASGTIPVIVSISTKLICPTLFLLMTFLLNCLISCLTGTAFGTAATIGVICSTMGHAIGFSPILTGGAVVAGAYFGDRCSPVSTSALLIATITKTDIFSNIKGMIKTAAFPFLLSCGIYFGIGISAKIDGNLPELHKIFEKDFDLSLLAVIPAVILLLMSLFRLNVKIVMLGGIISSAVICFFVQDLSFAEIIKYSILGFSSKNPEISLMLNGGGIVSMIRVSLIILISSAYSGIFKKTGLLDKIKHRAKKVASDTTPFISVFLTSAVSGLIACNQTLTIMLCDQLCNDVEKDKEKFAIMLENTAVVIAPLVPWSIAGAVPLTSVNSPASSLFFAFFLYLLPLCEAVSSIITKHKEKQKNHCS